MAKTEKLIESLEIRIFVRLVFATEEERRDPVQPRGVCYRRGDYCSRRGVDHYLILELRDLERMDMRIFPGAIPVSIAAAALWWSIQRHRKRHHCCIRRVTVDWASTSCIAGTKSVLLAWDVNDLDGIMGFRLNRRRVFEDGSLGGTFDLHDDLCDPARPLLQCFHFVDFDLEPDACYEYRLSVETGQEVVCFPTAPVKVLTVRTHPEVGKDGSAVYFNRGTVACQDFHRKFQVCRTVDVLDSYKVSREEKALKNAAFAWLGRGLDQALLDFLGQTHHPAVPGWKIRACVYHFDYMPVMQALRDAHIHGGADVKVIFEDKSPSWSPENRTWATTSTGRHNVVGCVRAAGLSTLAIPRRYTSGIPHNKFFLLLRGDEPVALWTGSTNITRGSFFGHLNVGHVCQDPALLKKYQAYWDQLQYDPTIHRMRMFNSGEAPQTICDQRAIVELHSEIPGPLEVVMMSPTPLRRHHRTKKWFRGFPGSPEKHLFARGCVLDTASAGPEGAKAVAAAVILRREMAARAQGRQPAFTALTVATEDEHTLCGAAEGVETLGCGMRIRNGELKIGFREPMSWFHLACGARATPGELVVNLLEGFGDLSGSQRLLAEAQVKVVIENRRERSRRTAVARASGATSGKGFATVSASTGAAKKASGSIRERRLWALQREMASDVASSARVIFSPRPGTEALQFYADLARQARSGVFVTLPFTLDKTLAAGLLKCTDVRQQTVAHSVPVYVISDKKKNANSLSEQLLQKVKELPNGHVTYGCVLAKEIAALATHLCEEEFPKAKERGRETLLNGMVNSIHTKFMIVDPMGESPVLVTGSANFSSPSCTINDENMLIFRGPRYRRLMEIYLVEFMRVYDHFKARDDLMATYADHGEDFTRSRLLRGESTTGSCFAPFDTAKYRSERAYFSRRA